MPFADHYHRIVKHTSEPQISTFGTLRRERSLLSPKHWVQTRLQWCTPLSHSCGNHSRYPLLPTPECLKRIFKESKRIWAAWYARNVLGFPKRPEHAGSEIHVPLLSILSDNTKIGNLAGQLSGRHPGSMPWGRRKFFRCSCILLFACDGQIPGAACHLLFVHVHLLRTGTTAHGAYIKLFTAATNHGCTCSTSPDIRLHRLGATAPKQLTLSVARENAHWRWKQ